jgi:transcriptional regulator with XRE-family HTH domain
MQPIPSHMALVPTKPKHAGGRPSKYWEGYCERVVALGRGGMSKTEIAAELGVGRDTINAWEKKHTEFSDAMKKARDLSQAWWETQARKGIWAGKEFNATAYIFTMKNRFREDYADRQETTHKLDVSQAFLDMHRTISGGKAKELIAA